MDLTVLDFGQFLLLGAIIAGATELISRIRAKDYWAVVTIVSAVLIGGLFGLIEYYPNLDAVEGMVYGLATSGAITAIGARRSTPAPSKVVTK